MARPIKLWMGIDPGLNGGIAVILSDGEVRAAKMPATDREIFLMIDQYQPFADCAHAVLERVGVMPKQGIVSAFTFGKGVGGLRMALTAATIPFEEVTPQTWQKSLGCLSGGDKNKTKAKAQQLFPHLKITHAIADSLLIAYFAQQQDRRLSGEKERQEGWTRLQADREARRQRSEAGQRSEVADAPRYGCRT